MAPKAGFNAVKPTGQAFKDKSKPADVRSSNINAARGTFRDEEDSPIWWLANQYFRCPKSLAYQNAAQFGRLIRFWGTLFAGCYVLCTATVLLLQSMPSNKNPAERFVLSNVLAFAFVRRIDSFDRRRRQNVTFCKQMRVTIANIGGAYAKVFCVVDAFNCMNITLGTMWVCEVI